MKTVIESKTAPIPISPYSQAVANGNLLFVSGFIGQDPSTGKLVNHSIEAEIRQVFANIQAVVKEAGFEMSDIHKTTVFVTDFSFYGLFNSIYNEYFPESHPARSTVQVADLLLDARIEIEAIAVKNETWKGGIPRD